MGVNQDGLNLNPNQMESWARVRRIRHGMFLMTVIGFVLISVLHVVVSIHDVPQAGVAAYVDQTAEVGAGTEYFPAQYQNQAKNVEAEEHIQAF